MAIDYPFIFLNHGKPLDVYSFQRERYFVIWFASEITPKEQKKIEKLCPKPLKQLFSWGGSQVCGYALLEEDTIWSYYAKKLQTNINFEDKKAVKQYEKQIFQNFADDIARWAEEVHSITPIQFFVGLERIVGSDWDTWSHQQGQCIFEFIKKILENTSKISHTEVFILEKTLELFQEIPSKTLDKTWIPTVQSMLKKWK